MEGAGLRGESVVTVPLDGEDVIRGRIRTLNRSESRPKPGRKYRLNPCPERHKTDHVRWLEWLVETYPQLDDVDEAPVSFECWKALRDSGSL